MSVSRLAIGVTPYDSVSNSNRRGESEGAWELLTGPNRHVVGSRVENGAFKPTTILLH